MWSSFLNTKSDALGTPVRDVSEDCRCLGERKNKRVSGVMVTFFSSSPRRKSSNLIGDCTC